MTLKFNYTNDGFIKDIHKSKFEYAEFDSEMDTFTILVVTKNYEYIKLVFHDNSSPEKNKVVRDSSLFKMASYYNEIVQRTLKEDYKGFGQTNEIHRIISLFEYSKEKILKQNELPIDISNEGYSIQYYDASWDIHDGGRICNISGAGFLYFKRVEEIKISNDYPINQEVELICFHLSRFNDENIRELIRNSGYTKPIIETKNYSIFIQKVFYERYFYWPYNEKKLQDGYFGILEFIDKGNNQKLFIPSVIDIVNGKTKFVNSISLKYNEIVNYLAEYNSARFYHDSRNYKQDYYLSDLDFKY